MWFDKLARAGFATKGLVYIIIGVLAVQTAFNAGGKTTDSEGAINTIAVQPFGKFLLILVAIGLAGYALWRFVQAAIDPEHQKQDAKSVFNRIGYAISGVIYAGLGLQALKIAVNAASVGSDGGNSTAHSTERVLAQPFGQWMIGVVGAIVIGMGFYQFYKAYSVKFRKQLDLSELTPAQANWAVQISRVGIVARGIVFAMIGFFLIQAAHHYNPSEAKGLDEALQAIAQQPFGKILLGLVALGLIAYGIYMNIEARYRRLPTASLSARSRLRV